MPAPERGQRLLIIAPYFPPHNSPGATRMHKVTQGLVDRGADVTVLTRSHRAGVSDKVELNSGIDVIRVATPPANRLRESLRRWRLARLEYLFDIPDAGTRWNRLASRAAQSLHLADPFDAIWTSSNPLSASLLGSELSGELSIPLVVEFRDPWMQNPFRSWNTRLHYVVERRQQRRVMTRASQVVMNTSVARDQLLQEERVESRRVHVITNGFDPADYTTRQAVTVPKAGNTAVELAHVGNMYSLGPQREGNWKGRTATRFETIGQYRRSPIDELCRSPYYLFAAMEQLLREQPDVGKRVRFHQVGSVGASPDDFEDLVQTFGLEGRCRQTERVERIVALEHERSADILVLVQLKPGDGSLCPAVAAKTYGALASGKPILGLVPPGDMRDLLEASGRAAVADPDDVHAIASAIHQLVTASHPERTSTLQLDDYTWDAVVDRVQHVVAAAIEEHDG